MVDMTPVERSALIAFMLASGRSLSARKVAELTECKPDTARRLLNKLCRVLPLVEDDGMFVCVNTRERK